MDRRSDLLLTLVRASNGAAQDAPVALEEVVLDVEVFYARKVGPVSKRPVKPSHSHHAEGHPNDEARWDRAWAPLTAIATLVLAAVTAWLAWLTNAGVQYASNEISLEHRVGIVRICGTASRSEARDGDALMDLQKMGSDPVSYSDRLSADVLRTEYLTSKANDFVRCEIWNYGKLPVSAVQLSLLVTVSGKAHRVYTTPFNFIEAGGKRVFWVTNNTALSCELFAPDRIRYQRFSEADEPPIGEKALPFLHDHWTVRKDVPVAEHLDQGVPQF